jgi:hypothetical protein
LVRCGITTVAMESTGVYWIPLYDIVVPRQLFLRIDDNYFSRSTTITF